MTFPSPPGYSLGMHYTELFRSLREARGLTLDQLAKQARRHRNTVVNVESGRPVKFKTIARLMVQMGYGKNSGEMLSIGLLWLEAVSGIRFSQPGVQQRARQAVARFRAPAREAALQLEEVLGSGALDAEQIGLLLFAARSPEVLAIVASVRALAVDFSQRKDDPELRAAEEP